jgi:8-oxo-dGTP diphosphatase
MEKDFIGQVAVKALIIKNGEILIIRNHHDASLWELPGGHIDIDESVEEALIREVKEELGVDAKVGTLIYSQQVIHKTRGTPHLFLICTANLTDPDQPLQNPSEEIAEMRWVDKNSAKELEFYQECANALEIFWKS